MRFARKPENSTVRWMVFASAGFSAAPLVLAAALLGGVGQGAWAAGDAAQTGKPVSLSKSAPADDYALANLPAGSSSPGVDVRERESLPAKQLFGAVETPAPLPSEPIGYYTEGCAAGNVPMPQVGEAWQMMRPRRNRYWGQPQLIAFLQEFARRAKRELGINGLLIGDLSQPRGGPMTSGHRSHQIGLDADIWFLEMPDRVLSEQERNTMSARLVTLDHRRINPRRFTEKHARLLRMAAKYPQVQRIFVHPPIKKYMCAFAERIGDEDKSWLARIRPYWGHNYHFHIRLRCPAGATNCKPQPEPNPEDGTGCGKHLAWWYSDEPWQMDRGVPSLLYREGVPVPRPRPKKPEPRREITMQDLPHACRVVLDAR